MLPCQEQTQMRNLLSLQTCFKELYILCYNALYYNNYNSFNHTTCQILKFLCRVVDIHWTTEQLNNLTHLEGDFHSQFPLSQSS